MDAIKLRKSIKGKKPDFVRQDAHKKKKLASSWRKPRGLQSKMRLAKKGYRKSVTVGYGSPRAARGLDKSGLMPVNVSTIRELEALDKNKEGAVISANVGRKKKADLLRKAESLNISVLNIKDIKAYLQNLEKEMKEKKAEKEAEKKKKEQKKEQLKKEAEKKKTIEETLSEDDKKKKEKEEKDKLLTKKD